MSLQLEGVAAGYGQTRVLHDVNLTVPSGSRVALFGPNGAGKTTVLRVASGLLPVASGTITYGGDDLTGARSDTFAARGVTLIPEGRGVFPSLSVRENLRLFAPPDTDEDALEPALEAFPKLRQRLGQVAGTMSGGEQQMLAISRAYVRESPVVLLDEVSMGLAPMLVAEIYAALRDLADTGRSLLLVEQFASTALSMVDIAYVVAKGRIVFAGEAGELDADRLAEIYLGASAA